MILDLESGVQNIDSGKTRVLCISALDVDLGVCVEDGAFGTAGSPDKRFVGNRAGSKVAGHESPGDGYSTGHLHGIREVPLLEAEG